MNMKKYCLKVAGTSVLYCIIVQLDAGMVKLVLTYNCNSFHFNLNGQSSEILIVFFYKYG